MLIRPKAPGRSNPKLVPYYEDFTDLLGVLSGRIDTATRASSKWVFNSAGVLTEVAEDVMAAHAFQDHDPATLAPLGWLIEEQRVNLVRNPRGEGASSPSTLPTHWAGSIGTLSLAVSDPYVYRGMDCVDIRLHGTTSTTSSSIFFEAITGIPWLDTETKTISFGWQLIAGTTANISTQGISCNGYDSGSVFLSGAFTAGSYAPNSTFDSAFRRISRPFTGNNASLAYGRPQLFIIHASGVAVDLTIRVALPTVEAGAFMTSPILPPVSSPAASTRARDIPIITDLDSINFNAAGYTVRTRFAVQGLDSAVSRRVWEFSDGTADNRITLAVVSSVLRLTVVSGGVTQADIAGPTITANTFYRAAVSFANSSFRLSVNGTGYTEDTSGTVPTVDRLALGSGYTSGLELNGWLKLTQAIALQQSQADLNTWSGA